MRLYSLFWRREITTMSTNVRYFILVLTGCQDALDWDTDLPTFWGRTEQFPQILHGKVVRWPESVSVHIRQETATHLPRCVTAGEVGRKVITTDQQSAFAHARLEHLTQQPIEVEICDRLNDRAESLGGILQVEGRGSVRKHEPLPVTVAVVGKMGQRRMLWITENTKRGEPVFRPSARPAD